MKAILPALVCCLLTFTACVGPAPQARIRISTGERVLVNLVDGTVEGYQSKDAKVIMARLIVSPKLKQGIYDAGLALSEGREVASVRLEDVTDMKAVVLLEDNAPTMQGKFWRKSSEPVDFEAESMKRMHEIDESFRVYAFHITFKDGHKVTLLHTTVYFPHIKAVML